MNDLVPDFEVSLFENSIADVGIEFAELGIDSVLQDGLLKDIPIVGTIVGLGKFAQNIYDRNLLRQTLVFIKEFNSRSIPLDKIEKYREKLKKNPKKKEEELGRVLILLNRNIDVFKSRCEAKFYSSYIDDRISWDEFCELCDITDRLFMSDITLLKEAYENNGVTESMNLSYKHDRLISIGLLINEGRLAGSVIMRDESSEETQVVIDITEIGRKFYEIVFDQMHEGTI